MPRKQTKDGVNMIDLEIDHDSNFKKQLRTINNLIGKANLNLYGTDRTSDFDELNSKFHSLLNNEIGDMTNRSEGDITSFLAQVVSRDKKNSAVDDLLSSQFMNMTGTEYSTMQSFIYNAYKNRLLEQSDLHEVASQLIELSEAILITRDAIISADVVEGIMSRTLRFSNIDDEDVQDNISIIESVEKKFELLEKIKNFIIPKTLEYGEYYSYVIPYSKLFATYAKQKETHRFLYKTTYESVYESVNDSAHGSDVETVDHFLESCYKEFTKQDSTKYFKNSREKDLYESEKIDKTEFKKDLKNILNNISVNNDSTPLPIMEEGVESLGYLFSADSGIFTEATPGKMENIFDRIARTDKASEGITLTKERNTSKKHDKEFSDITGCYIKMIDPTRIIPIEIMNTTLGYYYVQDEDITPLSGAVSSTLYFTKFDEHSKQSTVIDSLAEKVVRAFDKPFLKNNLKFKEAIVDCFNYYNLNSKRIKFQFIPAEYIQSFKIDKDVNGNGTSMIKKSLFYAKLYLMLLLFKILSVILYSNDQKVSYIKQSGIDKDVVNKVQEIIRINQSRQVNISDLFSYTTLINKVGVGNQIYYPAGRSGERPIETEILSGQDVQLNNDFMEMLKNAYILGTGVPAAIVNYMNEADFAKVVEQNNTKYNGRVVNYQLDLNKDITDWYKRILKYTTNIPDNIIANFQFILQPPKQTVLNTKQEMIQNFQALSDFVVGLAYEDPAQSMNADALNAEIREFKTLYAKDILSMIDFDKIEKFKEQAKINAKKKQLEPSSANGDNGDDDGLLDDVGMDNLGI